MTTQILTMGDNANNNVINPALVQLTRSTSPLLSSLSSRGYGTVPTAGSILANVSQNEGNIDRSTIVSHLRGASSRQDIESVLRAKGKLAMADSALIEVLAARHAASMLPPSVSRHPLFAPPNTPTASSLLASASLSRLLASSPAFGPSGYLASGLASLQNSHLAGMTLGKETLAPVPATRVTKRSPTILFMECDEDSLSEYQCLIRKQIEIFEADTDEASSSVQGRNKQIIEGQVGIRCRHCATVPPRRRQKGCMYFPTKLDRIYQAAQNLSAFHLCHGCKHVPEEVRKQILVLRERKSPAGGGKRYWAEGVRCLGVYETSNGLRFGKPKGI